MEQKLADMLQLSSGKVKAMYEAVDELMKEGRDLYTLKVSDITSRAGIGKGTAYEYFETKEELISKAVFYQMAASLQKMIVNVEQATGFRAKIEALLRDIEENLLERRLLTRYLCYYTQSLFQQGECTCRMRKCSGIAEELKKFLKHLTAAASEEGLMPQSVPLHFAANAVLTQAMGYVLYLEGMAGAGEVSPEAVKNFVYQNIIRICSAACVEI